MLTGYPGIHVIVAINNKPELVAQEIARLRERWETQPVTFLHLGRNWGFAEGINRGMKACRRDYILVINDDAWVTPGAIFTIVDELAKAESNVAAVVPKVLLGDTSILDCVGAGMLPSGTIRNRGYGEVDRGQYDDVTDVLGACFVAVLLRRTAWQTVGPLWAPFFMYAEDSDWSIRARLAGFRFLACPQAVVRHGHSLSARTMATDWKWDLIARNSALVAVRCLPIGLATHIALRRLMLDIRTFNGTGAKRAATFLRLLPRALVSRHSIRGIFRSTPVDLALFDGAVVAMPS